MKNNCQITDYLKSLNPSEKESQKLEYNSQYLLWRDERYIGIATWTKDENIGDSFQKEYMSNGRLVNGVYVADKWKKLTVKEINDVRDIFKDKPNVDFIIGVRSHMKGDEFPQYPDSDDFRAGYYFSQSNDLDKRFSLKPL